MNQESAPRRLLFLNLVLFLTPIFGAGNTPSWLGGAFHGEIIWTVLVMILWAFVTITHPAGFRDLIRHKPLWPFFGFLLWLVLHILFAQVVDSALKQTLTVLAAGALAASILQLRPTRAEIRRMLFVLALAGAALALHALYQYLWGFQNMARDPGLSAEDLRLLSESRKPFASFPGSNIFGGYMLALLPIAAALAFFAQKAKARVAGGILTLILAGGLLLSASRAAMLLGVFLAIPLAGVMLGPRFKKPLIALFVLLLAAGYIAWNAPAWLGDTSRAPLALSDPGSFSESLNISAAARVAYWKSAWNMALDHPIVGGGLGGFSHMSRRYQVTPTYTAAPHNIWLKLFAETGLIGLALFVWLMVVAFRVQRGHAREPLKRDPMRMLIKLSLAALLLHGSLDIDFNSPAIWALCFVLAALLLSPELPPIRIKGRLSDPILRVLASTTLVLALVFTELFSTLGHSYGEMANIAMQNRAHDKALEFSEASVDYWPPDPMAHYRLSRLYLRNYEATKSNNELDRSKKAVTRVIDLNPYNPEFRIGLADVLASKGDQEAATRQIESAAALAPMSVYYQVELSRAQALSGNLAAAERTINQALKLEKAYLEHRNPNGNDLIRAHFFRAAILNDQERHAEAIREYESLLDLLDDPRLILDAYTSGHKLEKGRNELKAQLNQYIERARKAKADSEAGAGAD